MAVGGIDLTIVRLDCLLVLRLDLTIVSVDPPLILPVGSVHLAVVVGNHLPVVLFNLAVVRFDPALVLPVNPVDLPLYFRFGLSLRRAHFAFDLAWVRHTEPPWSVAFRVPRQASAETGRVFAVSTNGFQRICRPLAAGTPKRNHELLR